MISLKRVKVHIAEYLKYQPTSLSTRYFNRPLDSNANVSFEVQKPTTIGLERCKASLPTSKRKSLKEECKNLIRIARLIMGKEKHSRVKKEKKPSLQDQQKAFLEEKFKAGVIDFNALALQTNFSRQQIRNMWIKFQSNKSIFVDYRNQRNKLNEEHCQFIIEFFEKKENFDKTIVELYSELQAHFMFEVGYLSFWTLYSYVHKLSLSHKKIVYKVNRANIPSIKLKRAQVARTILLAHLDSIDFIYIDEISFNLELRAAKGWALKGKQLNASKPPKSKNYSVIVAMDINGYLGIKVVKGGVKGPEFISFMFELFTAEKARIKQKKTVFLMDNAKIHKSKDFMQKFAKHYTVLYNAPYTPQLNPIEFSFSKFKYLVKKAKPISEIDLMKKILKVANEISAKDCSEFIIHSLTFIEKALDQEDFF